MILCKLKFSPVLLLLIFLSINLSVVAASAGDTVDSDDKDDTAQLILMLHEFLAGASERAAHERFWAEDLVYTSSRGTRTTKAEIMQGFNTADHVESEEVNPVYSAADIQVKLYGTTAVVAFRLIATPARESGGPDSEIEVQQYLNTGTFLKQGGIWKVVAWQATKIPGD